VTAKSQTKLSHHEIHSCPTISLHLNNVILTRLWPSGG
jgi:hypothetical protein